MNRLNGPYSYATEMYPDNSPPTYRIEDANGRQVCFCHSPRYAQMVAAALTSAWRREKEAFEVAERVERE